MSSEIGIISKYASGVDLVIEWNIENFFNIPETDSAYYCSPEFSFSGEKWYLRIYLNGSSRNDSSGHVGLDLCKCASDRSIKQSFSLSLKTAKGEKYNEQNGTKDFEKEWDYHSFNRFIQRSDLTRRRYELVPDGVLTIIFTVKSSTSAGSAKCFRLNNNIMPTLGNTASSSGKCCHCKIIFNADSLSSHQKKCMHRPVKCPDCLEVVVLKTWFDEHECQQERPAERKEDKESSENTVVNASTQTEEKHNATSTAECPHCKLALEAASMPTHEKSCMDRLMKCPQCGEDVATKIWLDHKCLTARTNAIGNLLQDFKRLMVCAEQSDVTVTVRGEEFRLHRNILGVRNPFFGSRFNSESQEMTPGTLSIDDCDPDQFRTLIHYIYTGTADNLCPENVCGLYEVALAYQEPQMRAECLQLMMNTLSVDNFCDYTALALKHDLEELLQKATELFVRKTKEITRHVKWKSFLGKYTAQANELYMKAVDQYDEK